MFRSKFRKMGSWFSSAARWLAHRVDYEDVALHGGLALLFYGIYQLDRAWAFIVVGALFVLLATRRELAGFVWIARHGRPPEDKDKAK